MFKVNKKTKRHKKIFQGIVLVPSSWLRFSYGTLRKTNVTSHNKTTTLQWTVIFCKMLKNFENTITITKNTINFISWIPTFLAYSSSGVVDFKHSNRYVFASALKKESSYRWPKATWNSLSQRIYILLNFHLFDSLKSSKFSQIFDKKQHALLSWR